MVRGDAIEITANAAERFGVFGFKKDAAAQITIADSTVAGNVVRHRGNRGDTSLIPPLDVSMTGNPNLTFTHNASGLDTIVRYDARTWLDDGFVPLESITIAGSVDNDGNYQVDTVSGNTLTLRSGNTVTNEGPVANVDVVGSLVVPDPEALIDLLTPFTGSAVVTLSNATADIEILVLDPHRGRQAVTRVEVVLTRETPLGYAVGDLGGRRNLRGAGRLHGHGHCDDRRDHHRGRRGSLDVKAEGENVTSATRDGRGTEQADQHHVRRVDGAHHDARDCRAEHDGEGG